MSRINSSFAGVTIAMFIAITAQAQTPAPPAAPAAPRARGPALDLAVEAATVAVATCVANGFKTTVLVADSAGVPVAMLTADGAGLRSQSVAPTKIALALRYNANTGETTNRAKTDAALDAEIKADPKIGTARPGAVAESWQRDYRSDCRFGCPGRREG